MINLLVATIGIIVAFCSSAGCAITNTYGPYYGKVVDAETKEPIEGAAVLVVFYTEEYGPAGAIARYADAVETVTDKNGEFRINAHRVTAVRPLQGWSKYGYFTVYGLSYGHFPETEGTRPIVSPAGALLPEQYVTVELPKLKTIEERRRVGPPTPNGAVPYEKQAKLIELINREREQLGYPGRIDRKAWDVIKK